MGKVSVPTILLLLILFSVYLHPVNIVESSSNDQYEVTLAVIGPDGKPAASTYVDAYRGYPSSMRVRTHAHTGYTGNVTLLLSKGPHFAVISRSWTSPKFLAFYRFYVRENATFTVDVRELTVPVTLLATKPLKDRPFTRHAEFAVLSLNYPDLWAYYFDVDEAGYLQLYLPRNLKYSIAYCDHGSLYFLFNKNVQVKMAGAIINFDASKTGFIKPVFTHPTSPASEHPSYFHILIGGKQLPSVWCGFIEGETIAVSVGSYEIYIGVDYFQEEEEYQYHYYFRFNVGSVGVKSKKVTEVAFGGDLQGFLKPEKKYYKTGETIKLHYWFEDAYKRRLENAYIVVWDKVDDEWYYHDYEPFFNIYDSEGLLERRECIWLSGTVRLDMPSFGEPGTYTVELILDTGIYQGNVTTSTTIVIK